jgi:hypothetical protein
MLGLNSRLGLVQPVQSFQQYDKEWLNSDIALKMDLSTNLRSYMNDIFEQNFNFASKNDLTRLKHGLLDAYELSID